MKRLSLFVLLSQLILMLARSTFGQTERVRRSLPELIHSGRSGSKPGDLDALHYCDGILYLI